MWVWLTEIPNSWSSKASWFYYPLLQQAYRGVSRREETLFYCHSGSPSFFLPDFSLFPLLSKKAPEQWSHLTGITPSVLELAALLMNFSLTCSWNAHGHCPFYPQRCSCWRQPELHLPKRLTLGIRFWSQQLGTIVGLEKYFEFLEQIPYKES